MTVETITPPAKSLAPHQTPRKELRLPYGYTPAEKLGIRALEPYATSNLARPTTILGNAWWHAELALACHEPDDLNDTNELLDDLGGVRLTPGMTYKRDLLRTYTPALRERAKEIPVAPETQELIHGQVGRLLAKELDEYENPFSRRDTRGRIGELVVLSLLPDAFPGSCREEANPYTATFNHDCYLWDGAQKVAIQVKYGRRSTATPPLIFRLHLGNYLYRRLSALSAGDALLNAAPNFKKRRSILQKEDASTRLVASLIVKDTFGGATSDEQSVLASLSSDLARSMQRFKTEIMPPQFERYFTIEVSEPKKRLKPPRQAQLSV